MNSNSDFAIWKIKQLEEQLRLDVFVGLVQQGSHAIQNQRLSDYKMACSFPIVVLGSSAQFGPYRRKVDLVHVPHIVEGHGYQYRKIGCCLGFDLADIRRRS